MDGEDAKLLALFYQYDNTFRVVQCVQCLNRGHTQQHFPFVWLVVAGSQHFGFFLFGKGESDELELLDSYPIRSSEDFVFNQDENLLVDLPSEPYLNLYPNTTKAVELYPYTECLAYPEFVQCVRNLKDAFEKGVLLPTNDSWVSEFHAKYHRAVNEAFAVHENLESQKSTANLGAGARDNRFSTDFANNPSFSASFDDNFTGSRDGGDYPDGFGRKYKNQKLTHQKSSFKEKDREFVYTRTLKIVVTTFNVNERDNPTDKELYDWLLGKVYESEGDGKHPNIFAISLQECGALNRSKAWGNADFRFQNDWKERFDGVLRARDYVMCFERWTNIGCTPLYIYAHRDVYQSVQLDAQRIVPLGILGYTANKGAALVSFKIDLTTFTFIGVHLDAGDKEENHLSRLEQISTICQNFSENIRRSDFLFWLGDFNFRVTKEHLDVLRVIQLYLEQHQRADRIESLRELLPHCQSKIHALKAPSMFANLTEMPIDFPPSYKFKQRSDNYNPAVLAPDVHSLDYITGSSHVPSWCDRVFFTDQPSLEKVDYFSVPSVLLSDHKPVVAVFNAKVEMLDREAKRSKSLSEQLMKDHTANEKMAKASFRANDFPLWRPDQSPLKFMQSCSLDCPLWNHSEAEAVYFYFVCRDARHTGQPCQQGLETDQETKAEHYSTMAYHLSETSIPKCLTVTPMHGEVLPEYATNVSLAVTIDEKSAYQLNSAPEDLSPFRAIKNVIQLNLVLDLRNKEGRKGNEIYLPVSLWYQPHVCGTSPAALVRTDANICDLTLQQVQELEKNKHQTPELFDVPKEIVYILDYLNREIVAEPSILENMFIVSTKSNAETEKALDWMNGTTNYKSRDICPEALADCLLLYLKSMPSALFGDGLLEASKVTTDSLQSIINLGLQKTEMILIGYLFSFFAEKVLRLHRQLFSEQHPTYRSDLVQLLLLCCFNSGIQESSSQRALAEKILENLINQLGDKPGT